VILADTSIWVDHLRRGDATLKDLLNRGQVLMHPFIIGELALGDLDPRETILDDLQGLPKVTAAGDNEIMAFIHRQKLFNSGIGYVDVHLLAATRLTAGTRLWTRDKKLAAAAARLSLAANPHVE
jgi:predicted nucleic acid-binding protein